MMHIKGRTPARRPLRATIEALESRLALATAAPLVTLAGTTLTVEGTDGADRITVAAARPVGSIRLVINGAAQVYHGVGDLVIQSGAGDDVIRFGGKVTLPGRVEAGSGNDTIGGGAGPRVLLGGDGDDLITVGGGGRPAINGGSGRDRVRIGAPLGRIQVGASAGGDALRVLRQGYRLAPLRLAATTDTGPIVVGQADLDDARVVARLLASYQAGQTVSLSDATPAAAEQLRSLLGHDNPAGWDPSLAAVDLVSFRKVTAADGRTQSETTVVLPRQEAAASVTPAAGRREADQRALLRLTGVVAASPVVAAAPSDPSNLLNLASAYLSRAIATSAAGDEVQVVNTVYGARSFLNKSDFYYVLQEADYHANYLSIYINSGQATTTLAAPSAPPTILQPSPQTTTTATSVTSGVSYTIGGSIGFNESQGFNASVSASVTVSNSTTTTYPAISLINAANLATGVTDWAFNVTTASQAAGSTLTFYNQWIWQVPFTAYAPGQASIRFGTDIDLYESNEVPILPAVSTSLVSTVPTPFGTTFALQAPVVTSLSSSSVREGQTFTLSGTGLYPSLVTGVLVGGQAISTANYQVVNDREITIVAPDSAGIEEPVVVQTTQGVSNDNVTITVYP